MLISELDKQTDKNNRVFYRFSVRFDVEGGSINTCGWRYFPDQGKISRPSVKTLGGNYMNIVSTTPQIHNKIIDLLLKVMAAQGIETEGDNG